jgi:hypothetical protein
LEQDASRLINALNLKATVKPSQFDHISDEISERGNSIDKFICNDYCSKEISDSEYISDDSLKNFLKKLSSKNPKDEEKAEISPNQI